MYINKLFYLCKDTDHNEQVNDIVYKKIQYAYVTYLADENGKYDPRDQTKLRATQGVVIFDPIDINNFVPHKDVTHEMLLDWIRAKVNETELQNLNIQQFTK
jgi:hypothetical protein